MPVTPTEVRCAYSGLFGPMWWWRMFLLEREGIPGGAIPIMAGEAGVG